MRTPLPPPLVPPACTPHAHRIHPAHARGALARAQELSLGVDGSSQRAGDKAPLVGGVDKLPKDFEKPNAFVGDDQVGWGDGIE